MKQKQGYSSVTVILILLLCISFTNPVFSNNTEKTEKQDKYRASWFNIGMGLLAGVFSYSYQINKFLFSARGTCMGMVDDYTSFDIGILLGPSTKKKGSSSFMSLGIGIGLISGSFSQGGDGKTIINFPVEFQLVWKVLDNIGFGFYAFYNLNKERNLGTICLCFQFGRW